MRHADARLGLLSGPAWTAARPTICRSLGHALSGEETIAALTRELDQTWDLHFLAVEHARHTEKRPAPDVALAYARAKLRI